MRRAIIVVAALTAVGAGVARSGLVGLVRDQDRFEAALSDAGVWAPLLFVALFTLLVPVGVPGLVFVVPAVLIWPPAGAVVLSMAGGMTSSAVGMVFARHLGRRALERRLPPRFRRWDDLVGRSGLWGVVLLRVFTYLAAPADWVVGLSKVPMGTALVGTFLGLLVPTLFVVLVGGSAIELLVDEPLLLVPLTAATGAAAWWFWRVRRRRTA